MHKDLRNWRSKKKHVRNRSNAIERSGYFEDCFYHPCKVTEINPYRTSTPWTLYQSDVHGTSLVDPTRGGSCSMYHCAPLPLTKTEAEERANYWKTNGELAYLCKYVYINVTEQQKLDLVEHYKRDLGRDLL